MKVDQPLRVAATANEDAVVRSSGWLVAGVVAAGFVLIAISHQVGRWLQARGYRMQVNAPPLTGNIDASASARGLAALALGAAGIARADYLAERLTWRRLLLWSFIGALAWAAALAWWDGASGFTRSPTSGVDYLQALPFVGDAPGAFLRGFVGAIDLFPSHVRAHPPGLVLTLWAMGRVGMSGAPWVAALEVVVGASSVPAVLLAIRELRGPGTARRAAPFLVFAPFAVFWSSGDAVFMGVGAWAVTLMTLATGREGRRSDVLALSGGLLAGLGLLLSYGLILLGVLPIAVAIHRRRTRTLMLAAIPVLAWFAAAAWAGFWWFDGLAATRREYAESLARVRPYWYFLVADLAALAIALGPAIWVALARQRGRVALLVTGGAMLAVVVADVSGLSKGEVERIWLPFMPWLMVAAGAAFTSRTTRRRWLTVQVAWAIALQMIVRSPW